MDSSAPLSSSAALVIWGSTGKRLQFTKKDLQIPEDIKNRPNCHFFEKQWDPVSGFWMNRVLKESFLQHMTVEDIVQCIVRDIERRWEQRRREKMDYKKRKRLLDPKKATAAGVPSANVLFTNIISLEEYQRRVRETDLDDFTKAILTKVEEVAHDKVLNHTILLDESEYHVTPEKKKLRTEATDKKETSYIGFDDRIALVCTLTSKERAAAVIAALHGSIFDSRKVLCRFYDI